MPHMKPKSMQLSMDEAKKEFPWKFDEKGKPEKDIPMFPQGLAINLDNTTLAKLGMTTEDFKMEGSRSIIAHVKVTEIRNEERIAEEPDMSVTLQITDLGIGDAEASLEDQMFKS